MISLSSSKASGKLTDLGSMRLRFIRGFCSPSLELCFKREIIRAGNKHNKLKMRLNVQAKPRRIPGRGKLGVTECVQGRRVWVSPENFSRVITSPSSKP